MGATLTAVFIRGTEAYIAEVGDSRGYLLRNGRLRQMTRDQSMVQMLVDQGVMSKEDARRAPGKNVILQAVGLNPDVRVAIGKLELRRGDRLRLCSDGVSNQISDDEIREILTRSEPRAACETMIALANDRGGEDNETVIVADVLGEELREVEEFETVTSTFEVLQAFEARPSGKPRRRSAAIAAQAAHAAAEQAPAPAEPVAAAAPARKPQAMIVDDEPEIEVHTEPEPEPEPESAVPVASADTRSASKSGGWITSLIGRLGRPDKPKR
jgi:hypothetical protein